MTDPGARRCADRGGRVWVVAALALLAGACGGSGENDAPRAATSPSSAPATVEPGTAAPRSGPGGAEQAPVASSPSPTAAPPAAGGPKTVTFGRISFSVPQDWGIDVAGDTAYVGVLAGGPQDATLRVQRNATGPIDTLKPDSCPREGDEPEPATSVVTAEQGLRPVGDRKAEYRLWRVTCPTGGVTQHRAWLLPTSGIAIYEQVYDSRNAAVVANAKVR